MIGEKNGKGYELKQKLDAFISGINQKTQSNYPFIALSGKEDGFFKNNQEQKGKDFAELNFGPDGMLRLATSKCIKPTVQIPS